MGTYINKGNFAFQGTRNGEYVDKSELIAVVNKTLQTRQRYSCVSRSRRFGKSMAAEMLCAYYDKSCDSRHLFADLKIASHPSFEQHLNKYPVIYVDMTNFVTDACDDIVKKLDDELVNDISKACVLSIAYYAARDKYVIHHEYQSGKGFADLVLIPRKHVDSPAVIVELKYDKDADTAISQFLRKQYPAKVAEYADNLLLVGISYDRETKQHECKICLVKSEK